MSARLAQVLRAGQAHGVSVHNNALKVADLDDVALSNLGTLLLRPAAALPTGEFWSLSREEADERNGKNNDGVEPLTQEEYVRSQDLSDGGEYFRVRYKYRNTLSFENPDEPKYHYHMFEAESLWRYTRRNGLNPSNREEIWREDWRELHDKYAPGAPEPDFVDDLPSLDDVVFVYKDSGGLTGRLVREELARSVTYYEGYEGEEHKVRKQLPGGTMLHYEGDEGEEHLVRSVRPNGSVTHYEGDQGEEHRVRTVLPDGTVV